MGGRLDIFFFVSFYWRKGTLFTNLLSACSRYSCYYVSGVRPSTSVEWVIQLYTNQNISALKENKLHCTRNTSTSNNLILSFLCSNIQYMFQGVNFHQILYNMSPIVTAHWLFFCFRKVLQPYCNRISFHSLLSLFFLLLFSVIHST